MRTINDDDEVDAKFGFMIKDLELKTYCTPESLEPLAQEDPEKHACT